MNFQQSWDHPSKLWGFVPSLQPQWPWLESYEMLHLVSIYSTHHFWYFCLYVEQWWLINLFSSQANGGPDQIKDEIGEFLRPIRNLERLHWLSLKNMPLMVSFVGFLSDNLHISFHFHTSKGKFMTHLQVLVFIKHIVTNEVIYFCRKHWILFVIIRTKAESNILPWFCQVFYQSSGFHVHKRFLGRVLVVLFHNFYTHLPSSNWLHKFIFFSRVFAEYNLHAGSTSRAIDLNKPLKHISNIKVRKTAKSIF